MSSVADRLHTTWKSNIVDALQTLAELCYAQQDNIRGDKYYEASYTINNLNVIPATRKELKTLSGIGDGISDKIIEMLYTGRLQYLDKLKKDHSLQTQLQLLSVSGIGPKSVEKFRALDVHSIDDLRKAVDAQKIQLTPAQTLGLTHHDDLHKRIPRSEIQKLDKYLQTKAHTQTKIAAKRIPKITIVGSYRRKKSTSGDIDILLLHVSIAQCVEWLKDVSTDK